MGDFKTKNRNRMRRVMIAFKHAISINNIEAL